ncbi:MAG: NADP-dependent isocitrate dehydrogenase [Planctomycetota bacterium]|nr:MAG: NADP-dependent isocitrate dehydrogenase [Planctomycetota bacterium]
MPPLSTLNPTPTTRKTKIPIAVAAGDGIGPEITRAVLAILEAAQAPLHYEHIEVGEACYLRGEASGIAAEAWEVIDRTGILLKGPITTPRGGGWKSLNVTLRKTLGLYANVRPVSSWGSVLGNRPAIDLVVIRENEEDLYAGIEHQQTPEVVQCLKLMTRAGCERIARYAFAYARAHGRKRVTCMVKDNIMKLTDGLFRSVAETVAAEYPEIAFDSQIIDIGAARLATRAQDYDVILAPNLYGDILSDIAAEVAGSVGLAPSANIGIGATMFEAIHGSAPDIAGQGIANPSAMLLAALHMLRHLDLGVHAARIQNAWLRTLEKGLKTADLAQGGPALSTMAFAEAVIDHLGERPLSHPSASPDSQAVNVPAISGQAKKTQRKDLVGVDIFVEAHGEADDLATALLPLAGGALPLKMITNRGVMVWPKSNPHTACSDHWRCRFLKTEGRLSTPADIIALLGRLSAGGIEIIKTEHLYHFDGQPGYSLGQGQ